MLSLTADKTKCQKLKNSRSRHPSHDPNPRYFREPRDLKWPHSNWFGVISMIGTMRLVRWPGRKFLNQKKNSKIYPHILIFGQDILIHSRKQLVFWRVPLSIRACPYWAHVSGSPNCHQIQSVLCTGGSSTFFTVSLLGTFLFVNENTLETLPSKLKVKSVEEINAQSVTKTGEIFALSICDASGVKFTILSTFFSFLAHFVLKSGLKPPKVIQSSPSIQNDGKLNGFWLDGVLTNEKWFEIVMAVLSPVNKGNSSVPSKRKQVRATTRFRFFLSRDPSSTGIKISYDMSTFIPIGWEFIMDV